MIPEALIVRARAVRIESELARRGVKLRRQSRIWLAGPCPLCGGDDRFSVNAARQLWHCRRCEVGGNVIQLVQHLDDLKFSAAVCLLAGESEERRQAPQLPQDDTARTEAALALWHQARDPRDTLVE